MKQSKTKRYEIRYSQEDIDAHGSHENLRKAILATRDLNPLELQTITNKAIKKLQDESLTKVSEQQLKK